MTVATVELLGAQRPRVCCVPERVSSAADEAVELARRAGLMLDPWQKFVLDGALGERADGKWAAFETGVVVSRQNGKGSIIEARELAGLFLFGEELILHSAHEFKDLDCDTLILTSSGWATMGELNVGDEVFAPDGQPTKVIGAHPVIRTSDCYRVSFADGQSLVAGGGHLWSLTEVCRSGVTRRRVVTTEEVLAAGLVHERHYPNAVVRKVKRFYRWRADLPEPLQAPYADLPVEPYILGMWLGDGDAASGRLSVGAQDLAHVQRQVLLAGEDWRISKDARNLYYVRVVGLTVRLRDALGVLGDKRIPDRYLTASVGQRRALLAGIMDTDGTVSGHQLAVTMVKRDLMEDVLTLVRSLGYRATLRTFRASLNGKDAGPMYRVQFAPTDVSPFRMARKTAKIIRLKTSRSAYNAITAIERVPIRPTRCITVAHESECYLAGPGLVPTHNTAVEAFRRIRYLVENSDDLRKRVAKIPTSHGDEGIELRPSPTVVHGSGRSQVRMGRAPRLRFVARTGGSGRGFSGDLIFFDEAFNLPAHVISALMPTLSARPNPQLWYLSSAVNQEEHPNGVTLARVRDRGLGGSDPSLAYFEWSADEVAYRLDPEGTALDPGQWALANPALGIRISPEHVARECRSMGAVSKTFAVERLGIGDWPDPEPVGSSVIDLEAWAGLVDESSSVPGAVVFGVGAAPDRSFGSIAAVGARADGLVHGELVEYRAGIAWMTDRLVELARKHGPLDVVLDPSSAAGSLLPGLLDEGVEPQLVSGREFAQACGGFYDAVVETKQFRHRGQQQVTAALLGARKRVVGDAWAWDRKQSGVDISPLDALTLAHHGYAKHAGGGGPTLWL